MKRKDHDYSMSLAIIAIWMAIGSLAQCESAENLDDIRRELGGIKHELNMMRYKQLNKQKTMSKLTFGDIKKLEYDDNMPFEYVLVDLLYKKDVDVNFVLSCYTEALDKERHLNAMRFSEACVNLTQMLGDNFKGKEKQEVIKRAIHTFNLNTTLVPHVHDAKYGYTSEDEKEWDEFCERIYGTNLKK